MKVWRGGRQQRAKGRSATRIVKVEGTIKAERATKQGRCKESVRQDAEQTAGRSKGGRALRGGGSRPGEEDPVLELHIGPVHDVGQADRLLELGLQVGAGTECSP